MTLIRTSILVLACCVAALAQTNRAPQEPLAESAGMDEPTQDRDRAAAQETTTNAPTLIETHIYSDSVELGIKTRSAVYIGNVRLVDPRIELTCERLTADVPEEGNRVEKVVAETNVVILMIDDKGLTNRAFADRAVYTYQVEASATNETVELTGDPDPHIERPEGDLYGNPIVWDRTKNQVRARNQRMIYRGDPTIATNSAAVTETNILRQQMKAEALEATSSVQATEPLADQAADE